MGTSAEGEIFYGFYWGEGDAPEEEIEEIQEWKEPHKSILDRHGVEFGFFGHYDYSFPFFCVKDSHQRSGGWDIKSLDLGKISLLDTSEAELRIRAAAQELGIDLSEAKGPGWFLTQNYG